MRLNRMRQIRNNAIASIDERYGDGAEFIGSKPLAYHNGAHTRRGLRDIDVISSAVGFTREERELCRNAFAYHDFIHHEGDDEKKSAQEFREAHASELDRFYLSAGVLGILGTQVSFADGTVLQQARVQNYPTTRAKAIAYCVAGADVGVLWTPEGPWWSHKLLEEMHGPQANPDQILQFQKGQLSFLLGYEFPTREIEKVLSTHKKEVANYVAWLVTEIEKGNLTNLGELYLSDKRFMADHN